MNKRLTGWLRFIPLIFAVLLASSCGGGENAADKDVSSASSDGNKRQTLSVGSVPATEKRLSVASISLVNSIRISRTVFQYAYAVTVSNSGSEVAEAAVQLKSVGDGTTIVNGSFKTGPIRAGGSSSVGTITVQQDRTFLFSVDRWSWAMDVFDPPTTVGIDPSVPTASRSAVTKLISPEGSAAPGSPTPISLSNPNHESLILGVNSKGEILLASIATGRQTSLSTSSTAQALVRVAFGSVPEALTAAGLNSIIKNTASFSKLVESIQQVLLNATPPMSSEQVVIQIGNVLSETAQALPDSKALAQNRSNTKTKLSTVALPTVDAKGLPYSIVPDTLSSFLPVAVEDTCGNMLLNKCVNGGSTDKTAIAIANPMPIPWVARSTSLDGAVLTGPLKMPALKVDSALSFLRRLTVPWSLTDTTGPGSKRV